MRRAQPSLVTKTTSGAQVTFLLGFFILPLTMYFAPVFLKIFTLTLGPRKQLLGNT